eukprot:31198-Pelagococcus_subviridis.AAC.58
MRCKNGARGLETSASAPGSVSSSKRRSARSPSATITTRRLADGAKSADIGSMPCTRGVAKWTSIMAYIRSA